MHLIPSQVTQTDADSYNSAYTKITKQAKRKPLTDEKRKSMTASAGRGRNGATTPDKSMTAAGNNRCNGVTTPDREYVNDAVAQLAQRWQQYWIRMMERKRKLQEALEQVLI